LKQLYVFALSSYAHADKIQRDDAWNHYPYPSIGLFVFTDLGVSGDDLLPHADPAKTQIITTTYQNILSTLKSGGKFLDLECMFAQDTRKLVHDGVPPENVYGTDLHGEYFDFGYKLFRDEEIIPKDHFIAADILDENSSQLKALERKFSVLNATHVIHVFNLDDQKRLLKRFISLLKSEPGVIITGRLTGHLEVGYHVASNAKATTKGGDGKIWEHNVDSFKELWREVGDETGTHWDVKAWFWRFGIHTGGKDKPRFWHRKEEHGIVTFIVTRL
jgi:SAM-dependent methyltransferase